jgi:hypothetical protein
VKAAEIQLKIAEASRKELMSSSVVCSESDAGLMNKTTDQKKHDFRRTVTVKMMREERREEREWKLRRCESVRDRNTLKLELKSVWFGRRRAKEKAEEYEPEEE